MCCAMFCLHAAEVQPFISLHVSCVVIWWNRWFSYRDTFLQLNWSYTPLHNQFKWKCLHPKKYKLNKKFFDGRVLATFVSLIVDAVVSSLLFFYFIGWKKTTEKCHYYSVLHTWLPGLETTGMFLSTIQPCFIRFHIVPFKVKCLILYEKCELYLKPAVEWNNFGEFIVSLI